MYKIVLLLWICINYGSIQSSDEVFLSRNFQSEIEHLQWRTKRNTHYKPSIADLCTLPPYPEHGSYTFSNLTNLTPGQTTTTFELMVSCDDGYLLVGGGGTPEGAEVFCFYGEWNQAMPKCEQVQYCRLNPNPSVRYECQEPGTSWFKPCPLLVSPGTLVNPVCNSPFYYSHNSLLYMTCSRGSWNYIAQCTAECGRVVPAAKQLVIGGREAERGELPWHVAIYDKTDHFKLICGGSIVSNHLVISAAHCFWSDASKILPASNFAVATGKQYSPYDSKDDVDAQKSDIKDIKIPKRYLGVANNLQGDIAVVILTTPFEYKTYVRPVCLNFDKNFDRRQLQAGKLGKIAGFGLTAANSSPSPVLKVVDLPYVDFDTCINTVGASFREFLTLDKFCAGYTNGTALCQGDSGGGLAFVERDLGVERYYLRGVVSASPRDDNTCSQFTVTTFTRITAVDDFIKEAVATSMVACASFQYQCANGACVDLAAECNGTEECTDGSDESHLLCHATTINMHQKPGCVLPPYPANGAYTVADSPAALPGQSVTSYNLTVTCHYGYVTVKPEYSAKTVECVNGTVNSEMPKCAKDSYCGRVNPEDTPLINDVRPARRGELPWHVGIYKKTTNPYMQICGGSLISNTVVISAAPCFWDINSRKAHPADNYAVAIGKLYRPWNYPKDQDVQKSDIKEIRIPKLFLGPINNYQEDIAILTLTTAFIYNTYVRPVCLHFDPSFERQQLQSNNLGKVASWGFTVEKCVVTPVLQVLEIPYIDDNTCIDVMPASFLQFLTGGKFCAGFTRTNGTALCKGGGGGGLVFPDNGQGAPRYYLRGIASAAPSADEGHKLTAFTKISKHEQLILEYL